MAEPNPAVLLTGRLPSWQADLKNAAGFSWLMKGVALLRAARILVEQVAEDDVEQRSGRVPDAALAKLDHQAVYLAALATENALKAAITETLDMPPLPPDRSGKLPEELRGHDIAALATRANIAPADASEGEAIARGRDIIQWMGRYQTSLDVNKTPVPQSIEIDCAIACPAYERIFFRAAEKAVTLASSRWRAPDTSPSPKDLAEVPAILMRMLRGWAAVSYVEPGA